MHNYSILFSRNRGSTNPLGKYGKSFKVPKCGCISNYYIPSYPDGVLKEPYRRTLRQIETIDDIVVTRVFSFIAAGKQKLRRILSYVSFSLFAIPSVIFLNNQMFFCRSSTSNLSYSSFLSKNT